MTTTKQTFEKPWRKAIGKVVTLFLRRFKRTSHETHFPVAQYIKHYFRSSFFSPYFILSTYFLRVLSFLLRFLRSLLVSVRFSAHLLRVDSVSARFGPFHEPVVIYTRQILALLNFFDIIKLPGSCRVYCHFRPLIIPERFLRTNWKY